MLCYVITFYIVVYYIISYHVITHFIIWQELSRQMSLQNLADFCFNAEVSNRNICKLSGFLFAISTLNDQYPQYLAGRRGGRRKY